ncbi:NAD(P)/FAD-dependent oxidoreductase [Azoarcus sp. KH32C]|uniref:flavin monoamine oxidase family protein n=1 Tax=Azoarcus sp. KH32C TaxID=748247 RepID=UPI0002386604|nr:NAD(P)/FAD-dependent oxidoreductase [Azoarcus sp. KH32C]BAL24195.1 amine oxidase [Azoarcus sp. KH32C]
MQKPSHDGSSAVLSAEPSNSPAASRRDFLRLASATAAGSLLSVDAGAANKTVRKGKPDVVVVGGGFAGVTAARELAHKGAKVLLLEARNRLGGRTFYSRFGDKKVELGGTWVHWSQPHVWSEIMRYGMELEETPGAAAPERVMWLSDGKVQEIPIEESTRLLIEASNRFHEGSEKAFPRPYLPFLSEEGAKLDHLSMADRIQQLNLPPVQRDLLAALMAANCNNRPGEGAFTEMLRWWALADRDVVRLFDACVRYKFKEGTASLINRMVADGGFEVRLSTVVSEIKQTDSGVVLVTESGERIEASYAIMALPVNTLGAIDFKPALLPGKQAMARERHAGAGHKVYIKVKGELGSVMMYAPESEPLNLLFSDNHGKDGGTLIAFGRPGGQSFDVHNPKSVEPLVRKFLPQVTVTDVLSYDWHLDPYSLGTWCTYKPNQFSRYMQDLRAHQGRVFFAGSDIAAGWRGFIDGAIETGLEVAQAVSSTMRQKA